MSARIEGLQKMLDTCSPKMKALYQRALEEERAKQAEEVRVKAEVFAQRRKIAEAQDDVAFALAEELYGEDYEVRLFRDAWLVTSSVAHEWQAGEYSFVTEIEANSKYRWLLLQRLYNAYVRTGEAESVAEIKS